MMKQKTNSKLQEKNVYDFSFLILFFRFQISRIKYFNTSARFRQKWIIHFKAQNGKKIGNFEPNFAPNVLNEKQFSRHLRIQEYVGYHQCDQIKNRQMSIKFAQK